MGEGAGKVVLRDVEHRPAPEVRSPPLAHSNKSLTPLPQTVLLPVVVLPLRRETRPKTKATVSSLPPPPPVPLAAPRPDTSSPSAPPSEPPTPPPSRKSSSSTSPVASPVLPAPLCRSATPPGEEARAEGTTGMALAASSPAPSRRRRGGRSTPPLSSRPTILQAAVPLPRPPASPPSLPHPCLFPRTPSCAGLPLVSLSSNSSSISTSNKANPRPEPLPTRRSAPAPTTQAQ